MEKGEIIEENNRKVKGEKNRKVRKIEAELLLTQFCAECALLFLLICLYSR